MKPLRRPISNSDGIPDRFYVISMEFLSLSRRRFSARNVPSGEERGETDVFAGYLSTTAQTLVFRMNDLHVLLKRIGHMRYT